MQTGSMPQIIKNSRFLLLFLILLFLTVIGHIVFLSKTNQNISLESGFHPVIAIKLIREQFPGTALFSNFNVPILAISISIVWVFTVQFVGLFALRVLGQKGNPIGTLPTAFAVGLTLTGFLILAMGMISIKLVSFILIPALILLAGFTIPREHKFLRDRLRTISQSVTLFQGISFIFLLGIVFAIALLPSTQSDGVRYHLGAPQEFIKNGRIGYLPLNAFSNFPFLPEMHFLAGLIAGRSESPQIMHFLLYLATAVMIFSTTRLLAVISQNKFSRFQLCIPAILYLCTPTSLILSTWPFTDHFVAFYFIASTFSFMRFTNTGNDRDFFILCIILAGMLGVKYTTIPFVGLLFLSASIIKIVKLKTDQSSTRPIVIGTIIIFVLGGCWFVKNLIFTGNPVYPFANSLFHSGEWTKHNTEIYSAKAGLKGHEKNIINLLRSPYDSTIKWNRYENQNPGITIWVCWIGIFSSGLILLFNHKRSRYRFAIFSLSTIAILFWLSWFFSYQGNRLLLPFFALSLPLIGHFVGSFKSRTINYLTKIIIIYPLVYGFLWSIQWMYSLTVLTPGPLPYLLGTVSKQSYLNRSLNYYTAYDYLNKRVKPNEKVLLIGEHRIYYADFHAIWSDWFDTPALIVIIQRNQIATIDQLLKYLMRNNIRWIAINNGEISLQRESDFRPRFSQLEWGIFTGLENIKESDYIKKTVIRPGVTIIELRGNP